jgi:hypothetical protein
LWRLGLADAFLGLRGLANDFVEVCAGLRGLASDFVRFGDTEISTARGGDFVCRRGLASGFVEVCGLRGLASDFVRRRGLASDFVRRVGDFEISLLDACVRPKSGVISTRGDGVALGLGDLGLQMGAGSRDQGSLIFFLSFLFTCITPKKNLTKAQ